MAVAAVNLSGHGGRCFSAAGGQACTPWPDSRLWVQRLPDGTAALSRQRSSHDSLALDVYSHRCPGTREVRVGGLRFWAFAGPRLGAEHLVVWRRVQDVRDAAESWLPGKGSHGACELEDGALLRLTRPADREQLTAAVWCWDQRDVRDPDRYWDDGGEGGPWMYWESFWAPAEAAAQATTTPAFGDAAGRMLAPTLGAAKDSARAAADGEVPTWQRQDPGSEPGQVVPSTAIGKAQKDRAYAIVYQFNVWGSDVSRSGTGSDFWSPEARLAVTAMEAVIDRFGIRSMLDCACGDATWMPPFFALRHSEVAYCGVDIVPEVIEENRRKYPELEFHALDLAESPLPSGADLVFSKETVNHMDLSDAQRALQRFRDTGARYLLTNVHEGSANEEGSAKGCYTTYIRYDYELPPFNLKKVARVIEYQGPRTSYSVFELNPP